MAQRNLQLGNLLDFLIIQNLQIVGSNINRQVFLRLIQSLDGRFQVQLAGSDIVGNTQAVEYRHAQRDRCRSISRVLIHNHT